MGGYPSTSYLIDALRALQPLGLRERMHAADFGSGGHGHFVFPMARIVGSQGRVYAVDVQKPALASIESRARHEGVRHVKTVWSDLEQGRTDIPAGTLDRITLINVLYEVVNRVAVLREARHLLKPDGLVLVIEWRVGETLLGPARERRVPRELLLRYAHESGFTVQTEFQAGQHHEGLVLQRI